jgi:hypothetical protein
MMFKSLVAIGALAVAGPSLALAARRSGRRRKPVTWPAMSNRSLTAKMRPASGPAAAPLRRSGPWPQNALNGSCTVHRFLGAGGRSATIPFSRCARRICSNIWLATVRPLAVSKTCLRRMFVG